MAIDRTAALEVADEDVVDTYFDGHLGEDWSDLDFVGCGPDASAIHPNADEHFPDSDVDAYCVYAPDRTTAVTYALDETSAGWRVVGRGILAE